MKDATPPTPGLWPKSHKYLYPRPPNGAYVAGFLHKSCYGPQPSLNTLWARWIAIHPSEKVIDPRCGPWVSGRHLLCRYLLVNDLRILKHTAAIREIDRSLAYLQHVLNISLREVGADNVPARCLGDVLFVCHILRFLGASSRLRSPARRRRPPDRESLRTADL